MPIHTGHAPRSTPLSSESYASVRDQQVYSGIAMISGRVPLCGKTFRYFSPGNPAGLRVQVDIEAAIRLAAVQR